MISFVHVLFWVYWWKAGFLQMAWSWKKTTLLGWHICNQISYWFGTFVIDCLSWCSEVFEINWDLFQSWKSPAGHSKHGYNSSWVSQRSNLWLVGLLGLDPLGVAERPGFGHRDVCCAVCRSMRMKRWKGEWRSTGNEMEMDQNYRESISWSQFWAGHSCDFF